METSKKLAGGPLQGQLEESGLLNLACCPLPSGMEALPPGFSEPGCPRVLEMLSERNGKVFDSSVWCSVTVNMFREPSVAAAVGANVGTVTQEANLGFSICTLVMISPASLGFPKN